MPAISRNGQNEMVAAPAAMTAAEMRKADTSPAALATSTAATRFQLVPGFVLDLLQLLRAVCFA